mmetsp:Transcript_42330/g.125592  ORF Transcript_42330/g.125592 Transcript_42330/m.125592 type:complete len:229 (+) Transcript_42330:310-996(+)
MPRPPGGMETVRHQVAAAHVMVSQLPTAMQSQTTPISSPDVTVRRLLVNHWFACSVTATEAPACPATASHRRDVGPCRPQFSKKHSSARWASTQERPKNSSRLSSRLQLASTPRYSLHCGISSLRILQCCHASMSVVSSSCPTSRPFWTVRKDSKAAAERAAASSGATASGAPRTLPSTPARRPRTQRTATQRAARYCIALACSGPASSMSEATAWLSISPASRLRVP